jgi:hypothetical protein
MPNVEVVNKRALARPRAGRGPVDGTRARGSCLPSADTLGRGPELAGGSYSYGEDADRRGVAGKRLWICWKRF